MKAVKPTMGSYGFDWIYVKRFAKLQKPLFGYIFVSFYIPLESKLKGCGNFAPQLILICSRKKMHKNCLSALALSP